ncbi:MAG TPA: RNA polymerase sigma factor [Bryobacteraceae bacterium]|nr:RNA polymerase sigma factor [Bryobacteraceae bacterium]
MSQEVFTPDYLDRLRAADPETERHFVRYFSSLMRLKLRGMIRSPQVAEDVCQETFMRIFRILRSERGIESPDRLPAFVHTVCRNVALEHLRALGRHPQIPENAPDVSSGPVDFDASLVNEERKQVIRQVLGELNYRDQQILRMIYLEEVDKLQVCSYFRVKPDHLRLLLHRAKNRFRKVLEREGA